MNKGKMSFYEFNDATKLCEFVNNNENVRAISIVYTDYKYKLFYEIL